MARPPASPPSPARRPTTRPPCRSPASCRRRTSTSSWPAAPTASRSPSSWPRRACSSAGRRGWCPSARTSRRPIYALGFANRAALSLRRRQAGRLRSATCSTTRTASSPSCWRWARSTQEKYAAAAGRHQLRLPGHRRHRHPADPAHRRLHLRARGLATCRYDTMVEKALEVRGCKIKITKVPDPGALRPGLRGRAHPQGADVHVEFGGNKHHGLRVRHHASSWTQIDDGEIEVIGPDIDDVEPGHGAAAGHLGRGGRAARCSPTSSRSSSARSTTWSTAPRASGTWASATSSGPAYQQGGFAQGLAAPPLRRDPARQVPGRLPGHRGQGARSRSSPTRRRWRRALAVARKVYDERNRRLESMTDESVDTFYSCLLCQSFAPEPRLRHHAGAARPVRRLQLARRQGGLRDRRDRPEPAGVKGRVPRPGARACGRASTTTSTPTPSRPSRRSAPTRMHGPPDDQLRLLRGHRRAACRSATAS